MLEARNRVSCDSYRLVDCSDVTHSGEGGVLGQGMLRMLSAFFRQEAEFLAALKPRHCPPHSQ